MQERLLYLFFGAFLFFVVLFLEQNKIEPFESFSLRFNDINFELQKKEPSKDIVFVAVDEPSVNRFGRWPWNREIIAQGVEKLKEADIVLTDMIFSEATSPEADAKLADALSNLNASVCGFFLRDAATQTKDAATEELLDDSSLDLLQSQVAQHHNPQFVSAPFAEVNILDILQSCTLSGSFSTLAQSDKLFRSYPLAVYYDGTLFPSLGVQAMRLQFNSEIERVDDRSVSLYNKIIHLSERGFVRLNFYKREQYNIVSFLDVLEQKIAPSYFKGKIVILGITEVGSGDVVSTPVGFMYGPLLHYTFLSNMLQNHLIIEPKNIPLFLILFFALLPSLLMLFFKKILHRVILNLSIYLVTYGVIRALFVYEMLYIDLFYPLLALSLSAIVVEAFAFSRHERSSKFLKDAFSSYLSENLLDELIHNPKALTLGGEKKELSILFSDIRGFTRLSESMDPVDLVDLLNRYFTPMTHSVLEHNGMLDKYIGDALMAFYNAPIDVEHHADEACLSALEMIEHLKELNSTLESEGKKALEIGIGINTADVVVGNMGSESRFNYTVMGDGVNLASRVESLTKKYGVSILITEFSVAKLHKQFLYRVLEPVVVKGKQDAVLLYELMPDSQESRDIKRVYDGALQRYKEGDLAEAKQLFETVVKKYDDSVSDYFLKKIVQKHPWGVETMQTK